MRRFFLAGLVGAAVAALAFLAVLAFTDVRVTTETTPTRQQLIQELLTAEQQTGRGHVASSKSTTTVTAPPPSRCAVGRQLALRIGEPQGATGALAIPVGVSLGSGNECILNATARFSIRRTDGGVLNDQGEPSNVASARTPHAATRPVQNVRLGQLVRPRGRLRLRVGRQWWRPGDGAGQGHPAMRLAQRAIHPGPASRLALSGFASSAFPCKAEMFAQRARSATLGGASRNQ
jgi:hypothetical protein